MDSYSLKQSSSFDLPRSRELDSDDDSESDSVSISIYREALGLSGTADESLTQFTHKSSWSKIKRCWICDKHLTKLKGRRRHHCRNCGNTVCKEHASTKLALAGLVRAVRICDICNKALINNKHNALLLSEIDHFNSEHSQIVKTISEQQHLLAELLKDVERLRYEETVADNSAKESKQSFETRIKDESLRNLKSEEETANLHEAIAASEEALQMQQERHDKKLQDVATARSENAHLVEQNQSLQGKLEEGVKVMRERVHISEVTKVMCEICRTKLYNMSFSSEAPLSDPTTDGSQQTQRERSKSMVERKACTGDCELM